MRRKRDQFDRSVRPVKQSAGIILLNVSVNPISVLCLRAYKNWDFPKGQLDPGETHQETALRELEEETGYTSSDIRMIGSLLNTPESVTYGSGKSQKTATYFYAVLENFDKVPYLAVNPELGHPEHDEWRWANIADLPGLLPKRLQPIAQKLSASSQNLY